MHIPHLGGDLRLLRNALAAEFGYYDQAHLIAEFKEFTGLTPSQFFQPPAVAPALAARQGSR